ncbi:hypothetical protein [Serratia marcescens]|uniref:hypothetical protein n=1 Tax=Serratia marcescens TaxID=615 RepID=UPI00074519C3|nr:hypothetical protein [Serratia marcescens]CVF51923.1 Uncharacterised protein [Serratia marcescens]HEJ7836587.1 hypothetical protein [Serratia marcescens]
MEIFWIVVGVVVVIIFLINQNRTKVSDRTVVTHNRTIKTDDGEIRVQRTQVMDSTSTQYHKPGAASVASKTEYDLQAINNYYQQKAGIEAQQKHIQEVKPAIEAQPIRIEQPKAITSIDADENLSHSKAQEGKKQCTRCRISLPYSKFSKSSKHPDGVTIWCTSCLKGEKNTKHMKWCPICKVRRKRTSFYPNNSNADGLMAWCKNCWDKRKGR